MKRDKTTISVLLSTLSIIGVLILAGTTWKTQKVQTKQPTPIREALDKIPLNMDIMGMRLSGIEKPTEDCRYLIFSGERDKKLFITFCPKEIPESERIFVKNRSLNTPPLEGKDFLYFFLSSNMTRETARERVWEFLKFIET